MQPIAAIQLISPANSSIISNNKKKSTSDALNDMLEKKLKDHQPSLKRVLNASEIRKHLD